MSKTDEKNEYPALFFIIGLFCFFMFFGNQKDKIIFLMCGIGFVLCSIIDIYQMSKRNKRRVDWKRVCDGK